MGTLAYPSLSFHPQKRAKRVNLSYAFDFCFCLLCFPGGTDGTESSWNTRELGSIPVLGRYPGEGNGNPLQYSCLEISMNRRASWATVHGVTKNQIQLSDCHFCLLSVGIMKNKKPRCEDGLTPWRQRIQRKTLLQKYVSHNHTQLWPTLCNPMECNSPLSLELSRQEYWSV